MRKVKDLEGRTPAEERRDIGTPAGESPAAGRKRHGTKCLTEECEIDEFERRKVIEGEISDEDFDMGGEEIGTTGGITGTKVKGGIPAGGITSGGTQTEPEKANQPGQADKSVTDTGEPSSV